MEDMPGAVKAGDECPNCHYSPLYEDAGFIVCVGCDARFVIAGGAVEPEPEEEDE